MPCSRKTISYSALILVLCIVSACSSTKISYSFLDWALGWQVGKYVALDSAQNKYTKAAIDDFHLWHRKTQLPLYADYIRELKPRLLSGELTGEQIHTETDTVQIFIDHSIEKLIPPLVELASTLSDEQTHEVQKNLKKERDEYQKKYIDVNDEKRFKLRQKEMLKYLKRLIGPLNAQQKIWLQSWSEQLLPYEEMTLNQQKVWASNAKTALSHRNNLTRLEKHIRALMFYHSENWEVETQATLDKNQEITYDFVARVYNNLDHKQTKHLEKALDKYIKDFEALSRNLP